MNAFNQIYILVEVFGSNLLLRKRANKNAKWDISALGEVLGDEGCNKAAARILSNDLGLIALVGDLTHIAIIPPSMNNGYKQIALFSYLMDPFRETLVMDNETIGEVLVTKLSEIVDDIGEHRDEYEPSFVDALNIFLAFSEYTQGVDK